MLAAGTARAAPTEPGELVNEMQTASSCVKCHAFANAPEQADDPFVSPVVWRGSIMGGSARDPVFWAGVAVAHQDAPGETTDCVRCHAPRAFVAGREAAIAMDELDPDDLSGVDCELCHRMLDDGVTPPGNARYTIDDVVGPDLDIPKRGPWEYGPGLVPMHGWAYDPYVGDSRMCGTCHDVTTPAMRVDADGNPLGVPFGEQRTYSEWKNSDFAAPGEGFQSCQDCHMPAVADVAGCAEFNAMGETHPTGGRRHDLAGANRRMVELLKQLYGDAGEMEITDTVYDLALASIDRTLAEAATLEVVAPATVDLAAGIDAWTVTVTNETGHKLPSGYSEGRVMWLEVLGRVGEEVVYSSGRWIDGQGLEGDPQQRTYEALAVEHGSGVKFHLLRNNTWTVDSRIPPRGLKQDLETDPVGDRYALLPDQTWPHFDTVSYAFPPAQVVDPTPDDPAEDTMTLSVRLLYLINTPEYLQFLADENQTNDAGATALALYEGLGPAAPVVLAEWSQAVTVSGLLGPDDTSSGGSSEGDDGGPPTTGGSSGPLPGTTGGGEGGSASGSESAGTGGGDEGGGCGCRGAAATPWWAAGLLLVGRRRRRR